MTPFSTEPMYCLGTTPPTILSWNPTPLPRGSDSISRETRAYWPWPPVCFLCVYSAWALLRTVSRYGTLGMAISRSTPNLRRIFSSATSTCEAPRLLLGGCPGLRVGLQGAGEDAEVGQPAHVRVGRGLEDERHQRLRCV